MSGIWDQFRHEAWVWAAMIQRCHNPNNKSYFNYGDRGITVCARWRGGFRFFLQDMGPRPSSSHTIERVDNDAGYSPDNCVWAPRAQQAINKRVYRKNPIGVRGVTWDRTQLIWVARIRINGTLHYLGKFHNVANAISARHAGEALRV